VPRKRYAPETLSKPSNSVLQTVFLKLTPMLQVQMHYYKILCTYSCDENTTLFPTKMHVDTNSLNEGKYKEYGTNAQKQDQFTVKILNPIAGHVLERQPPLYQDTNLYNNNMH
jgi:hypothetical protein